VVCLRLAAPTRHVGRVERHRPLVDGGQRRLDLRQAAVHCLGQILDAGVRLLKPVILGLQRLPLGLLLGRDGHLLAPELAQAEAVAIRDLRRDLDPAPTLGPHRLGLALQLFRHQPAQQGHVLQPAAVIALEQVAQHGPACRLIGIDADKPRPLVRCPHRPFGQQPADDVRLLAVGRLQPVPYLLLPLVIAGDGERHQLVQGHRVLGVEVQQLGRYRRQPQPLLYDRDRDEERGRDLLLALALLTQCQEGPELVQRVQQGALDVLGQAVLLGDAVRADHARDWRGLRQALLLHQQLERPIAASAGRDLVHPGLQAVRVQHGAHGDGLQQGTPGDVIGTVARLGVRRRSPLAGVDRWLAGIAVRSRNRACHYRRRTEPAAAGRPRGATNASAVTCSFGGSPGRWPSPR